MTCKSGSNTLYHDTSNKDGAEESGEKQHFSNCDRPSLNFDPTHHPGSPNEILQNEMIKYQIEALTHGDQFAKGSS
jgi:hypothetical protein